MWECGTQGLIASTVIRALLLSVSLCRLSSETSELPLPKPYKHNTTSAKTGPCELNDDTSVVTDQS